MLNGTVTVGSGSGAGIAPYVISPLEGIVDRSRHSNIVVDWNLATQEIHFPYITNVASLADKCIVFASAFQAEGADRQDLKLAHNSDGVINEVARSCADTIVVVHSGQTVDMEGWIDNENVTAVVWVTPYPSHLLLTRVLRLTRPVPHLPGLLRRPGAGRLHCLGPLWRRRPVWQATLHDRQVD